MFDKRFTLVRAQYLARHSPRIPIGRRSGWGLLAGAMLDCDEANACKAVVFNGTDTVLCSAGMACWDADFSGSVNVTCNATTACFSATFKDMSFFNCTVRAPEWAIHAAEFWQESSQFMAGADRARMAASLLHRHGVFGESRSQMGVVVDMGAGFQVLSQFLPHGVRYAAVDVQQRVPGRPTTICNLNRQEFPFFSQGSVLAYTFLGSFEYMLDKMSILRLCRSTGAPIVMHYQVGMAQVQNNFRWVAPFDLSTLYVAAQIASYRLRVYAEPAADESASKRTDRFDHAVANSAVELTQAAAMRTCRSGCVTYLYFEPCSGVACNASATKSGRREATTGLADCKQLLIRVPLREPAAITCPRVGRAQCAAVIERAAWSGAIDSACVATDPAALCARLPEDGIVPLCAVIGGAREALLTRRSTTAQAPVALLTEQQLQKVHPSPAVRRLNVVALSWMLPIKPPAEGLPLHLAPSGDNLGNLVWRYATQRLVDERETVLTSPVAEIGWLEHGGRARATALLHPEANLLIPEQFVTAGLLGHTRTVLAWVRRLDLRMAIIGIGAQIPFGQRASTAIEHARNEPQLGSLTPDSPSVRRVRLPAEQRELLWAAGNRSRDSAANIVVRGRTTQTVLSHNGVPTAVTSPLGCPSFMLNADAAAGAAIAEGWRRLTSRPLEPASMRLALLLPNLWSDSVCGMLFGLFVQYPRSFFVLQQDSDRAIIERARREYRLSHVDPARVLYYYDVEAWRTALLGLDLVVGSRIHGAMMGHYASVPSAVVATDHRILELCAAMHVPHVVAVRQWLSKPAGRGGGSFDLNGFVRHVAPQFDGAKYDLTRATAARVYVRLLESLGVAPSIALKGLARERA